MDSAAFGDTELRLFPLKAVLFPGGLMSLTVFENRYLALVTECARSASAFGAVAWTARASAGDAQAPAGFAAVGTRAQVLSAEAAAAHTLLVRCRGSARFRVVSQRQQADGLWTAVVRAVPQDEVRAPPTALLPTVRALATTIAKLKGQNAVPFAMPYEFDDAGWVANRWCEILPIPQDAKQRLMELTDPVVRLQLVNDFLRQKGVLEPPAL